MKQPKRRRRLDPNTLQLIKQIVGGILVLALLAVLVVSTWYVTRLPGLTIQTIDISGGETISHELVRTLVETELEGAYLSLIPRRFALFYPRSAIMESVNEVDRLKELQVELVNSKHLSVSFSEYVPDALWCGVDSDTCIFLDVTGFAFARAPSLSGGSFLRFEKLGGQPETNVQAFATENYKSINELVALLENNNWYVSTVIVDSAGDAFLQLADGGELKVAVSDSAEQVIENLFTVLTSPEFSDLGPGEFEYIDLRFGNKVFVNEFGAELATTTEDTLE